MCVDGLARKGDAVDGLGQVQECVQLANAAGLTFGVGGEAGTGQGDDGTTFSDFVCTALTMVGVGRGLDQSYRTSHAPIAGLEVEFVHLIWACICMRIGEQNRM